jgi:hypothetical protein
MFRRLVVTLSFPPNDKVAYSFHERRFESKVGRWVRSFWLKIISDLCYRTSDMCSLCTPYLHNITLFGAPRPLDPFKTVKSGKLASQLARGLSSPWKLARLLQEVDSWPIRDALCTCSAIRRPDRLPKLIQQHGAREVMWMVQRERAESGQVCRNVRVNSSLNLWSIALQAKTFSHYNCGPSQHRAHLQGSTHSVPLPKPLNRT